MSICAAHCSWVCCSKSTSRMTSYSSSVSRIGSTSSPPFGQKVSTCGAPQIRRHRGGLGMDTPPFCFRYIPIMAHRAEKSNILFKSRCNFRPHVELVDIRSRMLHMSYVDFLVCKRCFRCWLCDFLFSRQNGAERKQRPIFTFFPPPFSSHSARHRLLLLGYPLSGKSTCQLSTYKRKNYWIYKLSIYFSNARFHMFFGFRPASGRESVSLVCPHCRL